MYALHWERTSATVHSKEQKAGPSLINNFANNVNVTKGCLFYAQALFWVASCRGDIGQKYNFHRFMFGEEVNIYFKNQG